MEISEKKVSYGSILIPKISIVPDGTSGSKEKNMAKRSRFGRFKFKKFITVAIIVLLVFAVFAAYIYIAGRKFIAKAQELKTAGNELKAAVAEQNLVKIKSQLAKVKTKTEEMDKSYKSLSLLTAVPFASKYYVDGRHALNAWKYSLESGDIVLTAVEPYADIIGFTNGEPKNANSGAETTEDRINFVVKTIPEILPKADLLVAKSVLIKKEVDNIDPRDYPENFMGKPLRSMIETGVDSVDTTVELVQRGRPFLEVLPDIIGSSGTRKYMVIFQNDKELRPTGGFITAYSIAKVSKGHFEPILSDDIYKLDEKYKPTIAAPSFFPKYLKGIYQTSNKLRLRDMNWEADFQASMKNFSEEIKKVGVDDIDGIIAVDTQMLVNLLDVIGPIGVPGYGNFSTNIVPQCKCPQVIYELESFADVEGPIVWSENEPGKIVFAPKNYDNRKKIIGPLMNSILANTMGQPKDKLPKLFDASVKSLMQKHVLFYLKNPKEQEAASKFGIAGRIQDTSGDYLYINDANLGGRKSNLYLTEETETKYETDKNGKVIKTVTITYKNTEKQDGWLNSVLPNWVRIYVPKGSKLISFDGVEDKVEPYEEYGKTVFAGGFNLRPLGVAKVTLKYELPFTNQKEFQLLVQKQPGTNEPRYKIIYNGKNTEFRLREDKELTIKL